MTFKELYEIIKQTADNNLAVNTFISGIISQIGEKEDIDYPLFHFDELVNVSNINASAKVDVSFYILDKILKQNAENEEEERINIYSKTYQIGKSIVAKISKEYDILVGDGEQFTAVPLQVNYADRVYGWRFELTFDISGELSSCELPYDDYIPIDYVDEYISTSVCPQDCIDRINDILPDGTQNGDILVWDGSDYVPEQPKPGVDDGTLIGNTLRWDGSDWVESSSFFNEELDNFEIAIKNETGQNRAKLGYFDTSTNTTRGIYVNDELGSQVQLLNNDNDINQSISFSSGGLINQIQFFVQNINNAVDNQLTIFENNIIVGTQIQISEYDNTATAQAGMIQWNGTNFQGYNGSSWINLGSTTINDFWTIEIEAPTVQTYTQALELPNNYTIEKIIFKTSSGSLDFEIKSGGSTLSFNGNTTHTATSTQSSEIDSVNINSGDDLIIDITSITSPIDFILQINYKL